MEECQVNIQIFGKAKCFNTKKAERYFKERGMKFQSINMLDKGISKGEFQAVMRAVGGHEPLVDDQCKDKDLLALFRYLAEEDKIEKLIEYPKLIQSPIVRNGKAATVGYQPEIWKHWEV